MYKPCAPLFVCIIALLAAGCTGSAPPPPMDINAAATLTSAALQGIAPDTQPTQPPAAPTAEAQDGESQAGETLGAASIGLAGFDSFDVKLQMTVNDAGGVQAGSMRIDFKRDAATQSDYFEVAMSGILDPGGGSVTMTYTNDITYIHNPNEGCAATLGQSEDIIGQGIEFIRQLTTETLPDDLPQTETGVEVNGAPAAHYHAELHDPESEGTGLDVWTAEAGGHIVRMRMTGAGDLTGLLPSTDGLEGSVLIEYNLRSFNQPVSIQVPLACEGVEIVAPPSG